MVKDYRAAQGFKVKIGNAAGVEATLNGRPLGSLGPHGKVVDLLLPAGYRPAKP